MEENNCVVCMQPITNPICVECYIQQVDSWMDSHGMNYLARGIIRSQIRKKVSSETLNDEKCILCEKGDISLCSYCFFVATLRVLNELNFDDNSLRSFREIFSYNE